ncbi:MAG: hypothetical protein AB1767_00605 [Bacillota bacterium]
MLYATPGTREALSLAAACYYGFLDEKLNLIGVTGTNGKTTTTYYLHSNYHASRAGQGDLILLAGKGVKSTN